MNETHAEGSQYALLLDPHTGHELNLCRLATSIGRAVASDIVLLDRMISRQHAVISYVKGRFYVEDLGSTNGTTLNGAKVSERTVLRCGDEIKLGITRLVFLVLPAQQVPGSVQILQPETVPMEESIPQPVRVSRTVA